MGRLFHMNIHEIVCIPKTLTLSSDATGIGGQDRKDAHFPLYHSSNSHSTGDRQYSLKQLKKLKAQTLWNKVTCSKMFLFVKKNLSM